MKHNIDEPTLQKIADKVFSGPNTKSGAVLTSLELYQTSPNWNGQSHNRLILIKSALDLLPEPTPLVVDGKTPGQVAFEAGNEVQKRKFPDQKVFSWEEEGDVHEQLEAAASAVLAAFGGAGLEAAIARMEAVNVIEWKLAWENAFETQDELLLELKGRLIAAARGHGEPASQPAEKEYHMPKIPNPFDVQPAEIPWIEWHGGERQETGGAVGDVWQSCNYPRPPDPSR